MWEASLFFLQEQLDFLQGQLEPPLHFQDPFWSGASVVVTASVIRINVSNRMSIHSFFILLSPPKLLHA